MRDIKFRAFIDAEYMIFSDMSETHPYADDEVSWDIQGELSISTYETGARITGGEVDEYESFVGRGGKGDEVEFMQFTGITAKNIEIYVGDICEFPNGDRFIVCMEDWLEVYIDWVGEPKCEDQARNLCRIDGSKGIGNIHQNPELLKEKDNA